MKFIGDKFKPGKDTYLKLADFGIYPFNKIRKRLK